VTDSIDVKTNWLDPQTLNDVRGQVPLVYIDAVPVRVNDMGEVTHVGMLLRQAPDGSISRTVVSGRVLLGERTAPFTVVEYFPDPSISGFHGPRHPAVSLAYVVPVSGDCQPTQQALDLGWFTPTQATSEQMVKEMTSGHDRLVRMALASVGQLP